MTAGQLNTTEKGGGGGAKFAVLAQSCLLSDEWEQSSEVRREKHWFDIYTRIGLCAIKIWNNSPTPNCYGAG